MTFFVGLGVGFVAGAVVVFIKYKFFAAKVTQVQQTASAVKKDL